MVIDITTTKPAPSTERVAAICDHMYSLGAYTQAEEVAALVRERDAALAALVDMAVAYLRLRGDIHG